MSQDREENGHNHAHDAGQFPLRREIELADGSRRWYLLTVPTSRQPPYPLVIDLHGFSEGAAFHAASSGLSAYGLEHGFMTAVPDGSLEESPGTLPQWATTVEHNPEVAFVEAIMDELIESRPVDLARIYVVGLSNGGLLAAVLMCHLPHTIAATAIVAAPRLPQQLILPRAVPLVILHGTEDPLAPFDGGPLRINSIRSQSELRDAHCHQCEDLRKIEPPATPEVVNDWAVRHGAVKTGSKRERGVEVTEWSKDGVALFELYVIEKAGHSWPGSRAYLGLEALLGPVAEHVPANDFIWDFLSKHRLEARQLEMARGAGRPAETHISAQH